MNILLKRTMIMTIIILMSNIFVLNISINVQASEFNLKNNVIEKRLKKRYIKEKYKSSMKYIYIETQNCLNKYYSKNFKPYKYKDNCRNCIINNFIKNIENDKYKKAWSDAKLKRITLEDDNISAIHNLNEYGKNNEDKFTFKTIDEINMFDLKEKNKEKYSKDIVFNKYEGNDYKNNLNFEWYRNMIKIKVPMPKFKNTKYYYKLLNIDKEWKTGNENVLVYNNLNPGKYLLKIKAINDDGNIDSENQVEFIVKSQIWRSPGATSLYIILIILIIYLSITKVKDLDRMVEKRTKQLREEMEKNRKLFDKVIDLERRKNNYFVNLSHELRTPLNVISSTEQLITQLNKQENGIEKEKLDYYMKIIKRNSNRLLKLINNIIDTNKIESGRYELNLKENDIVYLVEESSLSLKDYIENKGIHLIIDPEVEEKTIMCDSYEIERCIVNLVSNAAKFTPEGGEISVILKEIDDKVVIIVKDNGIGIEPKYHKAIFDRFNQIVDANSETKGGSGLGLTITKHIIDLHKGEIYVNSDIGEGCEFVIILPINIK